jgi:hypothetical protein
MHSVLWTRSGPVQLHGISWTECGVALSPLGPRWSYYAISPYWRLGVAMHLVLRDLRWSSWVQGHRLVGGLPPRQIFLRLRVSMHSALWTLGGLNSWCWQSGTGCVDALSSVGLRWSSVGASCLGLCTSMCSVPWTPGGRHEFWGQGLVGVPPRPHYLILLVLWTFISIRDCRSHLLSNFF